MVFFVFPVVVNLPQRDVGWGANRILINMSAKRVGTLIKI
jgi:hypothetical protein